MTTGHEHLTDADVKRNLQFMERRYTEKGLASMSSYRALLREAVKRGMRQENLTPEQQLIRIELEGPGFES